MIAIVTLCYITLIIVIYKVLKIRPNPKNVAAMVVLGVGMIGAIVIFWKFSSPMSGRAVVGRYTVSLVPQVKGPITKIHAEPNTPLKGGQDILFQIQRDTFQNMVDQLTESLRAARKSVDQLAAAAIGAESAVKKADASRAAAAAELSVAQETAKQNADAISELQLQELTQKLNAADAAVEQAQAVLVQAKIGQQAGESTAKSLESQLANAQFDLDQTTVYAPADGFVTNWTVREGAMAVPLPLSPMGTFVDTSRTVVVASFPQNILKNVQPGDRAELAFKARPGVVLPAEVETIIPATGEGQFTVSGTLPSAASIGSQGMLAVKFRLDDQQAADELPMGAAGVAAIYTQTGKPFQMISKVTVRMKAWLYYLLPF
ncbi:Inner membrane protein YiaV precursor [Posidoniimonas corsicana]|uniref:Inner membrane protein YiaV n=1 Tax=Posidoniimonas corsicana TaxID=1938618 RepID=A0A5C5VFA5_9BACT|nr:efflux RND transporter periplasmic adaptor subunit [Posidoniimonas corsicana]TWT37314.1 Inner membrane protein YiaV precursor [Posidoniimonas corsicana]